MPRLYLRSLFTLKINDRGFFEGSPEILPRSLGGLSLSVLGSICDWGKMPHLFDEVVPDQHQWSVYAPESRVSKPVLPVPSSGSEVLASTYS